MKRHAVLVLSILAIVIGLADLLLIVRNGGTLDGQGAAVSRIEARLAERAVLAPAPPRSGEVVMIGRKRTPMSSYVLKLEGRTRGDECFLEPDDVKLTVLDLRDDWVMLRFERSGPQGNAQASPYAYCPGFDGILAMRSATFQDYRTRAETAKAERGDASRTLQDFYDHFPTPIP